MAPPKDIARSYPKRGITADVGFRSEPKFCGDGSVQLDGSNQYLATTLGSALGETFTVSCWVYRSSTYSAFDVIWETGTFGANASLRVAIKNSDEGLLDLNDNATTTTSTIGVGFGRWAHVVICAIAGSGNSKIYVDGIDATPASNSTFINATNATFEVGRYIGNAHYLTGNVSDIRIYDQTLTQDQIQEIYNNPGVTIPTGLSASNLIHRYKLETNYEDTGTGGNDLTAYNSPVFTVNRPQLPRGLDLVRGAAVARVHAGRAVDFDGSADYLDIGQKDFGTGDFSISLWFYDQQSSGGNRTLYSKGTYNTSGGLLLYNVYGATGAGEYILFRNDAQMTGGYDGRIAITSKAEPNQWHHIAVTRTGGTVKGYFDGKLTASSTNFNPAWDINVAQNSFIGARDPSSPGSFWDGFISSVKVWDTVLTDAQVAEQFHNPEQVLPTGTSVSNLDRHYPLSDYNDTGGTGGRHFQDMGADNAPAEDKGSAGMEFGQPVPCPQLGLQQSASCISMQDTSNATFYLGAFSGTPFTNQGTLSGWFVLNEQPANGTYNVMYCLGTYQTDKDLLEINQDVTSGGVSRIWTTNGSGSIGAEINHEFELGKLQHVVVTTLPDAPYWQLWINGVKQTVPTRTFSSSRTAWDFGTNQIGGGRWGQQSFGGTCHFIAAGCAAWNTVLSDSEIGQVYNSGVPGDVSGISSANLQVWWKCDDLTSFKDYSGNNVSGAVTAGGGAPGLVSFPENASGSTIVGDFSMKRKGVSVLNLGAVSSSANEYALSAKDSAFLPSFANGGAFSCFFRLQRLGEFSSIFINDDYNSGIQHRFAVYLNSSNKIYVELGDGASTRANPLTTGAISDSEWHHFAFTVDYGGGSTTTIKMFLDGVLDSTSTATTLAGVPNATELRFGDYVTSGSNEANGPIACLKFYQVTLSENEIKQIYNSDLRLIKGLQNE